MRTKNDLFGTFYLSWNEGRGGFLFALVFISVEIWGLHLNVGIKDTTQLFLCRSLQSDILLHSLWALRFIISYATMYKVKLIDSWTWMWDFIVMTIYVISSQIILFGKNSYKIGSAAAIYLAGSALILSLEYSLVMFAFLLKSRSKENPSILG